MSKRTPRFILPLRPILFAADRVNSALTRADAYGSVGILARAPAVSATINTFSVPHSAATNAKVGTALSSSGSMTFSTQSGVINSV